MSEGIEMYRKTDGNFENENYGVKKNLTNWPMLYILAI